MENEKTQKERLRRLGNDILTASKNELLVSMRFLELAFPMLRYQMNMGTFLIGTDGENLYFQPRFLGERYERDRVFINRAYLHSLFHCLFGHLYQETDWEGNDLEEEIWNLSCDIVCEYLIDSFEISSVKKLVDDRRSELYKKLEENMNLLTAPAVYDYIKENMNPSEILHLSLLFLVDDHCFWKQKKKDKKDTPDEEKEQKQQNAWNELSEKVESGFETYYRSIGNKTGKFVKYLKIKNRKKMDYRTFLMKFATMNEEMKVDLDSFDYGFYYYGMQLYKNMPLVEELEYKEEKRLGEFVIAIDTSGSCSGDVVKRFVEETFEILKTQDLFSNKRSIYLIQCDNEIKQVLHLTSRDSLDDIMDQFEIRGHGGTDFRPVFAYVDELVQKKMLKNLKGLLYFTDGYGIYPKKRTNYKTAFVFYGEDYNDKEVPPWAMKLVLEQQDLKRKHM